MYAGKRETTLIKKNPIHLPFTIVLNVYMDSLLHKRNIPIFCFDFSTV